MLIVFCHTAPVARSRVTCLDPLRDTVRCAAGDLPVAPEHLSSRPLSCIDSETETLFPLHLNLNYYPCEHLATMTSRVVRLSWYFWSSTGGSIWNVDHDIHWGNLSWMLKDLDVCFSRESIHNKSSQRQKDSQAYCLNSKWTGMFEWKSQFLIQIRFEIIFWSKTEYCHLYDLTIA